MIVDVYNQANQKIHLKSMLLLNSKVSEKKAAFLALQSIYGLGKNFALSICSIVGISPHVHIKSLNSAQLDLLIKSCRRLIPNNKKRENLEAVKALVKINSYRGTRHINALPARGQRTRTNGVTSKKLLSKFRSNLLK